MLERTTARMKILVTLFCFTIVGMYDIYIGFIKNRVSIFNMPNIITFILAIIFLITSYYPIQKIYQVYSALIATSIVCLCGRSEEISFGLFTMSIILIYRYHSLKILNIRKVIISLVILFTSFAAGIVRNSDYDIYRGLSSIPFFVVITLVLLIIVYDERSCYEIRTSKLRFRISQLRKELEETRYYLQQVDHSYIDPMKAGLTKAEVLLLEKLCLYKESNLDLGVRLNKSPNTVKVQLTRIMNKIGADTRYQLIDLCKNYFLAKNEG